MSDFDYPIEKGIILYQVIDSYIEWIDKNRINFKSKFEYMWGQRDSHGKTHSHVRWYIYFPDSVDELAFKMRFNI